MDKIREKKLNFLSNKSIKRKENYNKEENNDENSNDDVLKNKNIDFTDFNNEFLEEINKANQSPSPNIKTYLRKKFLRSSTIHHFANYLAKGSNLGSKVSKFFSPETSSFNSSKNLKKDTPS